MSRAIIKKWNKFKHKITKPCEILQIKIKLVNMKTYSISK